VIARYRDIILAVLAALVLIAGISIYPLNKKINLGLDLQGGMQLVLEVETDKLPKGSTVQDACERAIEIIRNRVDAIGVAEPLIQRQGESWITVQLPGIKDPQKAIDLIGQTALLEFKLVSPKALDEVIDKDGAPVAKKLGKDLEVVEGKDIGSRYLLEKLQLMTGASLATASVSTGEMGEPVVSFQMTNEGGRAFAKITGDHVNRQLAIILDGKVFSAPVIRSRIGGGSGIIEGRFTWEEARNLALVLRAGALPAPVRIINKEVVGPSLGKDSIDRGLKAALFGTLLVMIFMAAYYRVSGVIANVALAINFLFLLAILASLKATLTLPGIAGIALTMGMAVDGNVLILERIREELRGGKTVRVAIDNGYSRALATVVDSHVTTLLTAAILFFLGSGPIKGFAVTLFWGVFLSLFTAIVITRAVFEMRKQYVGLSI
jgi:protein-export membrane protein SecD